MVNATYVVKVDWDNSGTFDGGDEDVTVDLVDMSWESGRRVASILVGRAAAGKLSLRLRNKDDKYSAFNSASSLFNSLLPGRKIQISTTSPVTKILWTGFLESIRPQVHLNNTPGLKLVTLNALGSFRRLTEAPINMSIQTSQTTGALVDDVLDAAGWPVGDRDIDTGETTITAFWSSDDRDALKVIRELEATESGFLREQPDGAIAFESRNHRLAGPHLVSQATFSDSPGAGDIRFNSIVQEDPLELVFNDYRASVTTYSIETLDVLWQHPEANTTGDAPSILAGESRTYWAEFPTSSSPNDAVAVDAWTSPAQTTDYTANSLSNGTGTNLTSDINVTPTKFANTMKLEVTNNHATTTAFLTFLQARGTAIHENDKVDIRAEDTTSQTAYGIRTIKRPSQAKWIPTTKEAQDWADLNLALFKDAQPVLKLGYLANGSSDQMSEALNRQVSDRVTVEADSTAGLGFSQDFFVENIKHTVTSSFEHKVEYLLSSASGLSGVWVVGTSRLGSETRLSY